MTLLKFENKIDIQSFWKNKIIEIWKENQYLRKRKLLKFWKKFDIWGKKIIDVQNKIYFVKLTAR